jgi:rhamnosyltransferase
MLPVSNTSGIKPRICAVIVTCNPSGAVLKNVAVLRPQVDALVIVDNGSGDASMAYVEEARRAFECDVILNGHNLGIAAALNLGVRYAESRNHDWVALFDEDSTAVGSFVVSMCKAREEHASPEKIAIIVPQYVDRVSSTPMPVTKDRAGNILAGITSGSMIPVEVFRRCGAFDESLFMDYVDHEFCLRVRSMGFSIVQSEEASLLHSLGAMTSHNFLGRKYFTTNHRAARRYYITRNRVWLYKRYLWKDFTWTLKDARSLIAETGKILLVEQDRAPKLRNIVLGISDALRGRMGNRMPL